MTRHDDTLLRQYVLGTATPEQAASIEDDYFERSEALERIAAIEDDVIDDYLSGHLAAAERDAFEHHYLSTPRHRTRVAVARSLRDAAAAAQAVHARETRGRAWSERLFEILGGWSWIGQTAMAAAALFLAVGATMYVRSRMTPEATTSRVEQPAPPPTVAPPPPAQTPAAQPPENPPAPTVVAFTLSPIAVRSAGGAAPLRIPAGTDVVALRLEGEAQDRNMSGRALVRTVEGEERWRGAAVADANAPTTARIEVPADRLPPDDYIVELFGPDASGADAEKYRYVFRVRAR
jgi:hypothetical protein